MNTCISGDAAMRFIVWSDAHFHEFPHYATEVLYALRDGRTISINSRLRDCALALQHVKSYAAANDITNLFFCGDLLHAKSNVTKTVYTVLTNELNDARFNWFLLPGNHDMRSKDGRDHSLLPFLDLPHITVVDRHNCAEDYTVDGVVFRFAPYTESRDELVEWLTRPRDTDAPHVFLGHSGLQGAKVGSGYVLEKSWDISAHDVPDSYAMTVWGHYHEHQKLRSNVYVCGATHQQDWSDTGGLRGFIDVRVDGTTASVTHVETVRTVPRFIVATDDCVPAFEPWDFIKLQTTTPETLPENLQDIKHLDVKPIEASVATDNVLCLSDVSTDTAVLTSWLEFKGVSASMHAEFLEFGRQLLAEKDTE